MSLCVRGFLLIDLMTPMSIKIIPKTMNGRKLLASKLSMLMIAPEIKNTLAGSGAISLFLQVLS